MRRASTLLLNVLVILGLTLSTVLVATAPAPTQAAPSSGPAADAATDLAGPRAKKNKNKNKHKHEKKKKERKKDRKHKDRKKDRKQGQTRGSQPVELPTGLLPAADTVDPVAPDGTIDATDRYIVRLKPAAESALRSTEVVAQEIGGITPTHVYSHVFEGFAAVIPPDKLDDVRNDPRVAAVVPDAVVYAFAQEIPTGIRRIEADDNPTADIDGTDERVDIDVAVLDTAGKGTHEDLNIHAWANCTPSHENGDDHGHGTHVGGTIGALDNADGVVGVAPGARLWNLRVLIGLSEGGGSGLNSWIICGLDIATQYATPQGDGLGDIEVANLSLGGSGFEGTCQNNPYHLAYCEAVDAGVTVVVAAGNSDTNAANFVPAAFDEVITVSALADSNGEPGAAGPPTSSGPDESLATFSNWGDDVDIAAPGVDILSTVPGGSCEICDPSGYLDISGTSMASPHVAGAAALYLATHAGATPAQVKAAIIDSREEVALPNDPDGINEGVLNVGEDFQALSLASDVATAANADGRQAKDGKNAKAKNGKKKR